MVILYAIIYVLLCIWAYYTWHDFVVSPEQLVSKSQRVIESRPLRVLIRLSLIFLGPFWFIFLLVGMLYLTMVDLLSKLWSSLIR
jgi:hypothetical protein